MPLATNWTVNYVCMLFCDIAYPDDICILWDLLAMYVCMYVCMCKINYFLHKLLLPIESYLRLP